MLVLNKQKLLILYQLKIVTIQIIQIRQQIIQVTIIIIIIIIIKKLIQKEIMKKLLKLF